ncbi:MAG: SprT-like domain-containing protein [Anaerolineaceae bacterium]|nr:SprT-like domain-containing protein [Alphaproteobacteria bacterium]MDR3572567.1 SprT-like domain-containing protein [Anaerolineaceae bacterium]
MKSTNLHTTREGWLRAATDELRPDFKNRGYDLPEKMRFTLGFTSKGKRDRMAGECWPAEASDDRHYEIYIRPDIADPVSVLATLVHELVHALLPVTVKHGKEFRAIAQRMGLEGEMRHTQPTPYLQKRLQEIAANLGTLPHAKLNYSVGAEASRKQGKKWFKAECGADGCGYGVRVTEKWARKALPVCPINAEHGRLVCDIPDDSGDNSNAS